MILQTSNTYLVFGNLTEAEGILFLGVCLIALTIGIRWFLKRYDSTSTSETDNQEAFKR